MGLGSNLFILRLRRLFFAEVNSPLQLFGVFLSFPGPCNRFAPFVLVFGGLVPKQAILGRIEALGIRPMFAVKRACTVWG